MSAANGSKSSLRGFQRTLVHQHLGLAVKLSRSGSLIIIDNVVRNGSVIESGGSDPNVQGVRRLNELLAAEPRICATAIQTVGGKGYDGFAIALVTKEKE